jgi:hypothetical protein
LLTNDIQFSRALVNRFFAHFFVLGLVEPQNGFDLARLDPSNPPPEPWSLQASHPLLLNKLALFFQQNNYDLKALIKLITSSEAYGLSSRYEEGKWKPEYARLYARKLVRRLAAEEVLDAITTATAIAGSYPAAGFNTPFTSAMALPGVEEPSDLRLPQSDPVGNIIQFLGDFGRGDRETRIRTDATSIVQALDLFNSEVVTKRIDSTQALPNMLATALKEGKKSPQQAITELYLYTIARRPSNLELELLKDRIIAGKEAIADLQWALFNRAEFLYNY